MKRSKKIFLISMAVSFSLGLCLASSAAPKPDLTIVQMEVKPALEYRVAGSMVNLKAFVLNKGNAAAPHSKARIVVGTEIKQMWVGALEPKKVQAIYLNVFLKNPATYSALFEADIEKKVDESDETNNEVPFVFEVRPVNPPDLSLKNLKMEPANPTTKDTIVFSAIRCNAGDKATPQFKDSIQVGGESTPLVLGPGSIPGPYCGQMKRIMKITEAGNYRVTFKTDIDNTVPEANESDNEAFLSFTVKAAKPDLTVRNMKITPANPTTQDTITFYAEIFNIGNQAAQAGKGGIRVGGETNPDLYSFAHVYVNTPVKLARQMKLDKEGNYKVVFIADAEKTIDELDETNNEGSLNFTIRKKKPDLTLRNPKIEPADPKVNETIRFSAELVNIGEVPCPPTSNGTRVGGESEPNLGTYGVIPVYSPTAVKYAVGRVTKISQPGNYVVTFIADAKNQAEESNEGNNQVQLHFTVK